MLFNEPLGIERERCPRSKDILMWQLQQANHLFGQLLVVAEDLLFTCTQNNAIAHIKRQVLLEEFQVLLETCGVLLDRAQCEGQHLSPDFQLELQTDRWGECGTIRVIRNLILFLKLVRVAYADR